MTGIMAAMLAVMVAAPALMRTEVSERLNRSPRHHEWVDVRIEQRTVRCFVAYPEAKEPSPAVVVIHENKGLTDWERGVADELAVHGFVTIAPDLLSGMGPDGRHTESFSSADAATRALYEIPTEHVMADLQAVADYVEGLPACNGQVAVAGFCWGGGQALRLATQRSSLKAVFIFYGSYPHTPEELARIRCPVYGFYGENDARVNATLPATQAAMLEAAVRFDPEIYAGAGHGFMRSGEDPAAAPANREGRAEAWKRWLTLLKGM